MVVANAIHLYTNTWHNELGRSRIGNAITIRRYTQINILLYVYRDLT